MTELEAVLDELLAAWRSSRAPELGEAIDRVSAALVPTEKPIRTPREWTEAFDEARPARFPILLAKTPGPVGSSHLTSLAERPPDPRLGTIARTSWLVKCAGASTKRRAFYRSLFTLLGELDDVRVAPALEALANDERLLDAVISRENAEALVALIAKLHAATPKAADDALIARADAAIANAKPRADADPTRLFADVYANPGDDAIRAVLADLLTERGDPRGEFIALQLARRATKGKVKTQERALLKTWRRAWLGAMAPGVLEERVEYERGFVTRVRAGRRGPLESTASAAEWATVETLDLRETTEQTGGSGHFLRDAALGALRGVYGLSSEDMATLREGPPLPWEMVGFRIFRGYSLSNLSAAPFPNATKLVIEEQRSNPLDIAPDALIAVLAPWTKLTDLSIELEDRHLPGFFAHEATKRLRWIDVMTAQRDVFYSPSGHGMCIAPKVFTAEEAEIEAALIQQIRPSKVLLATQCKATLEYDTVATSSKGSMNIAAVRRAASDVGAEFSFAAKAVKRA